MANSRVKVVTKPPSKSVARKVAVRPNYMKRASESSDIRTSSERDAIEGLEETIYNALDLVVGKLNGKMWLEQVDLEYRLERATNAAVDQLRKG